MNIFKLEPDPPVEDMIMMVRQAGALAEMAQYEQGDSFSQAELDLLEQLSRGFWHYHIMADDARWRLAEKLKRNKETNHH